MVPSRDYNVSVDVGNVTQYRLSLDSGTYFMAATAYDEDHNESEFSNELEVTIAEKDDRPPDIVKGFKVTGTRKKARFVIE